MSDMVKVLSRKRRDGSRCPNSTLIRLMPLLLRKVQGLIAEPIVEPLARHQRERPGAGGFVASRIVTAAPRHAAANT